MLGCVVLASLTPAMPFRGHLQLLEAFVPKFTIYLLSKLPNPQPFMLPVGVKLINECWGFGVDWA